MAQVLEFKLPDLGEGLTEAEIVRWLVQVGDVVAVDQPVVEVETAKAMVDIPCPYAGVVTARFGEEGTELPVGAPLLTVAVGAPASGAETEGSGNVLVGYGTSEAPARRRRVRPGEPAPAAPAPAAPPAESAAANGSAAAREPAEGPVPVISPWYAASPVRTAWICGSCTVPGPTGSSCAPTSSTRCAPPRRTGGRYSLRPRRTRP